MTIQELFIASNEALLRVVQQIKPDQWSLEMPKATSRDAATLLQAIGYHTYDDAWVPDVLAGKTKEEVGEQYEQLRTLSAETAQQTYQEYNQRASAAVQDFTALDQVTHLSYGDFPARDFLQHIISFRAFRVYDIAKLLGIDTTMPFDLVAALTLEFTPVIEGYRQMGVFPPAISVAPDASAQTKLLAMVGRD